MELLMQENSRHHYTDDFKSQAIVLAKSIGRTKAAKQLGISVKTLGNWLSNVHAEQSLNSPPARSSISELESEINRLRTENAALKLEHEILRKAMMFLAREAR
jgi:transposase